MRRLIDWPQRLEAYIQSRMNTPFAWGAHDCCRFAAGAVLAMTDDDPMIGYAYTDEHEALQLIVDGGGLEALVTAALGPPLPVVAIARRGDVMMADLETGHTVGICLGQDSAFAAAAGLTRRPTLHCMRAWRVL
jgi:hypothetical protein